MQREAWKPNVGSSKQQQQRCASRMKMICLKLSACESGDLSNVCWCYFEAAIRDDFASMRTDEWAMHSCVHGSMIV